MKYIQAFIYLRYLSLLCYIPHDVLQYLREQYKSSPILQAYVLKIEETFSYLKS